MSKTLLGAKQKYELEQWLKNDPSVVKVTIFCQFTI
jgi:hypothetical protein